MSIELKYTQLNIGCLSRNKFWGEPLDRATRVVSCTSTLIELTDGSLLLVDPGLPYETLKEAVFNRRGISLENLKTIFITHFHGDHMVDLDRYEQCTFYASKEELALTTEPLPVTVEPYEDRFPGLTPMLLPGHTMGTTGLALVSNGSRVLIAGDVVATRDFYLANEVFHNAVDVQLALESVNYAREHFDIIVPGHDVQFPTKIFAK